MNFYICSVGEADKDYAKENFERCIKYNGHFMHNSTTHKGAYDDVKMGDVVFMKYENKLNAFGEVKKTENTENAELGDWNYAIYVDKWYFYDEKEKSKGVSRSGVQGATIAGDQFATIKQIREGYALGKIAEIGGEDNELLIKIKNGITMNSTLTEMVNLLVTNHNLILTGAPGTGKTYLAKQIAKQMIFGAPKINMTPEEDKQFKDQCEFVQFHPSYDYTDFVEGLRPTQDDNGSVGFEMRNGVFKEFCARAINNQNEDTSSTFDSIWDNFISDIRNKISQNQLTPIGNWEYGLSTKDSLKYSSENAPSKYSFTITKKNILDTYVGKQARPSGAFQKDMIDIVEYLKNQYGLPENIVSTKTNNQTNKNFVFIIDEINRGEISKIFGELFYSIDPGYRGKDGKVRTQYANMQTEPNEFDTALEIKDSNNYGNFFVPENVYIIGTMNDIDRSVESMDFAFRRRFAFKEITAEERQSMLDEDKSWEINGQIIKPKDSVISNIKNRMNNLNNMIWHKAKVGETDEEKCIDGFSSAYHIGASYFLKLANYKKDDDTYDFDKLWEYHLEGLLFEYLRGMTDASLKIKKLAKAYGYTNMKKYE